MVNSISSSMPASFGAPPPQAPLSNEQKELISETLAKYDVDNLSEEDALEIVHIFSEAGITPSREMGEAIADAGFDAREIGDKAGIAPPPPPSQQAASQQIDLTDLVSYLDELLAELGSEALDEEGKASVYESLREHFSLSEDGSIINVRA